MQTDTRLQHEILQHAAQCAPCESCGYVVRTPDDQLYIPVFNSSAEPTTQFRMTPRDYLNAQDAGEIQAVVHSHPGGTPWLSSTDRCLQVQSALPWWLVCGGRIRKFRCVAPLLARDFVHGSADCYALLRDAYHLAGVELPQLQYPDNWWRQGASLYLDNVQENGFYQVEREQAQPGDMVLACFASRTPNHCAVYCDNGQILHHLPNQLSKREDYSARWQQRTHSVWRNRHWQHSGFTGIYSDLAVNSVYTPPPPQTAYGH